MNKSLQKDFMKRNMTLAPSYNDSMSNAEFTIQDEELKVKVKHIDSKNIMFDSVKRAQTFDFDDVNKT
jgi:hypothetical protein